MTTTRTQFAEALDKFKAATRELDLAWSRSEVGGDAIDGYPECLPSFDEFAVQVHGMTVRPLLTHGNGQAVRVGQRVRLIRDVERFPFFVATRGRLGTICFVDEDNPSIHVEMDGLLIGAEGWGNQVCWDYDSATEDFPHDVIPSEC